VAALARIVNPALAERLVADGVCDLEAMVRANIAEPDLVQARHRRDGTSVRRWGQHWLHRPHHQGEPMRCIYNPVIGGSVNGAPSIAPPARRVLVIGGGPAGLEAARVAAQRGHHVTLLRHAELAVRRSPRASQARGMGQTPAGSRTRQPPRASTGSAPRHA
jgi:2,4-dienoyl-CoA reductase (NADPH2)